MLHSNVEFAFASNEGCSSNRRIGVGMDNHGLVLGTGRVSIGYSIELSEFGRGHLARFRFYKCGFLAEHEVLKRFFSGATSL